VPYSAAPPSARSSCDGKFLSWLPSYSLNSVLGALQYEQRDLLKKGMWCALMMPFASVFVADMAVGMEVAKKPQRMEAMVAVFIEVSLCMLVKPTNGHITGNGSDFKLSRVYKKWQ
jgi:hypothetical protein